MVECLLIDKDATERKRVSLLLGDMGLSFTESSAAAEGLKYCNDNFPEVVVMAASTDGMAASDFIRQVRRSSRGKKTVVILYADTPDAGEIGPRGNQPPARQHALPVVLHPLCADDGDGL